MLHSLHATEQRSGIDCPGCLRCTPFKNKLVAQLYFLDVQTENTICNTMRSEQGIDIEKAVPAKPKGSSLEGYGSRPTVR